MQMDTLTWSEFLSEAAQFCKIAERLGDNWTLYKKNDNECNTFLIYKQKIPNSLAQTAVNSTNRRGDECVASALDMLEVEYHIVYSLSYQVPMMYLRIYRSDGSLVALEDAWRIFRFNAAYAPDVDSADDKWHAHMPTILTQMEHPVLFKPFMALHPCRTAELIAQAGTSYNRVLTFISVMGPFVRLNLCNAYGLQFAE